MHYNCATIILSAKTWHVYIVIYSSGNMSRRLTDITIIISDMFDYYDFYAIFMQLLRSWISYQSLKR